MVNQFLHLHLQEASLPSYRSKEQRIVYRWQQHQIHSAQLLRMNQYQNLH